MRTIIRFFSWLLAFLVLVAVVILAASRVTADWREVASPSELAPDNGLFVDTPHGKMHVSLWGPETGQAVVMTHGMAAWGGLWEFTAKHLAQSGFRVIAVDMPPFGFSDRTDTDFSRSHLAVRLTELAEALKLDSYLLVGHSYGGGIAMETALRAPDHVSGLVLICPVIDLAPGGAEAGDVPFFLRSDLVGEALIAATITNPLMTSILTKRFMYRTGNLADRQIRILQQPMRLAGNTTMMLAWLRQFLTGDSEAWSRDPERLARSRVPVAMIWGDQDTVAPIERGRQLAEILKPAAFIVLNDVGHMPQLEVPGPFNEALTKALEGVSER